MLCLPGFCAVVDLLPIRTCNMYRVVQLLCFTVVTVETNVNVVVSHQVSYPQV